MELEIIAKTIGHHFWHCKTDKEAIRNGMDCAKEIIEELKEENIEIPENGIGFLGTVDLP